MNFFKKIFGSKDNDAPKVETLNENLLDSYKGVPWMTDTRLDNISICLNADFIPANSLPTEFERQLRPIEEIAKRLNAIKAIVLWLMVSEQDLTNERVLNFVETNELDRFLMARSLLVS